MNCPDCDKEFDTDAALKIHALLEHGIEEESPIIDVEATETAPQTPESQPKRANWKEKAKSKLHRDEGVRSRRRESGAGVLALAWSGMGAALIKTGADVPVGRTLQFQADVAGETLDKLIAGTFLDRLLQPIAQNMGAMEQLGALIALPVLVGAIERNEAMGSVLEPLLREAVMHNLSAIAPIVKKKKAEEAKFAKAVRDLDLGLPAGADPVEAVLSAIFAVPEGMGEPVNAA